MSGHSKWSNIKRDKAITDAKRGTLFTKVARLITVAAKQGGRDPDTNSTLRFAIDKAKESRMPKENIERAIKRGTGKGEGSTLEEISYEGFGPGGEAFLLKAITDNKNRTVAEIRTLFSKHGGSLGGSGSTAYIFSSNPSNPSFMMDVEESKKEVLKKLYNQLKEHDDIQEIYVNFKP